MTEMMVPFQTFRFLSEIMIKLPSGALFNTQEELADLISSQTDFSANQIHYLIGVLQKTYMPRHERIGPFQVMLEEEQVKRILSRFQNEHRPSCARRLSL